MADYNFDLGVISVYAVQIPHPQEDRQKMWPEFPQWPSPFSPKPHICPICNGKGLVERSFYPDIPNSTDASGFVKCRACDEKGVIFG